MNWFIPDNVQENPPAAVEHLSPTNLGLLLNSRLAAFDLGYLTLPELVELSERTLDAAERLRRCRGHLFNWYNCRTLDPLPPRFISSVDSGNLAACLWTLGQACAELSEDPIFQPSLWDGLRDHASLLAEVAQEAAGRSNGKKSPDLPLAMEKAAANGDIATLDMLEEQTQEIAKALSAANPVSPELNLALDETLARIQAIRKLAQTFVPWALPEYRETIRRLGVEKPWQKTALAEAANTAEELLLRLEKSSDATDEPLRQKLTGAAAESRRLIDRLTALGRRCDSWVREMDFGFLFNRERRLLSIGYDAERDLLHKACYDLMASEARLGTFVAVAKGDIPLETWVRLARPYTIASGERVLLSWSGTMFEYLMPTLWMRTHPGTLLGQSVDAAIRCQRRFGSRFDGLWGISESAHALRDAEGRYGYQAFGVPALALDPDAATGVLAPYATFLCLPFAPGAAVDNLQSLAARGWIGRFGFYESADFRPATADAKGRPELVRSWMVHHEGMSLLAAANLLAGGSNIRRFHRVPAAKGVERILQENVPLGVRASPSRDKGGNPSD